MDELRFVRREDLSLVVTDEADTEYRLAVDEALLSELRHLSRKNQASSKVRPREVQALLRAGNSRAKVAELTGLEESDVERYEEPVRAEREYIQDLANGVLVRADAASDTPQGFGEVMAERLASLHATDIEWSTWREDGADWTVCVTFVSGGNDYMATWSFDHRKGILSPISSDAVNLSKQGDVGDRLIPKLHAVEGESRTPEVDAAATAEPANETQVDGASEGDDAGEHSDSDAEYERRREIDQRAMTTDHSKDADLSQTADLLDALRLRRGQRERELEADKPVDDTEKSDAKTPVPTSSAPALWSIPGVGGTRDSESTDGASEPAPESSGPKEKPATPKKGRASVPSWDDILFGTRSDEDPA